MLATLCSNDFTQDINQVATLVMGEAAYPVTVVAVTEKPRSKLPSAKPEHRIPFSVRLSGPAIPGFLYGTVTLRAPNLGKIENLMVTRTVSVDGDPNTAWYEIAFN